VKIVSFLPQAGGAAHHGALLDDQEILDFDAQGAGLPSREGPFTWLDLSTDAHAAAARLVDGLDEARKAEWRSSGALLARDTVRLLSPVPRPGKVICIGLNYRDHAEESGMDIPEKPLVFSKFPTSVVGPVEEVVLPPGAEECDY